MPDALGLSSPPLPAPLHVHVVTGLHLCKAYLTPACERLHLTASGTLPSSPSTAPNLLYTSTPHAGTTPPLHVNVLTSLPLSPLALPPQLHLFCCAPGTPCKRTTPTPACKRVDLTAFGIHPFPPRLLLLNFISGTQYIRITSLWRIMRSTMAW